MKREEITFMLCGLAAGLISVTLGLVSPVFLAYGVGPLFFAAVVTGVARTGARSFISVSFLRYSAGLLLTTITYVAALITFAAVGGISQGFLGPHASDNVVDFGIDIWLGLIAAGIMGAIGISAFAALLTQAWNTSLPLRFILAALITIVVTFITNLRFRSYYSFFGILLPVGNALFCWIVGLQIWNSNRHNDAARPQT